MVQIQCGLTGYRLVDGDEEGDIVDYGATAVLDYENGESVRARVGCDDKDEPITMLVGGAWVKNEAGEIVEHEVVEAEFPDEDEGQEAQGQDQNEDEGDEDEDDDDDDDPDQGVEPGRIEIEEDDEDEDEDDYDDR